MKSDEDTKNLKNLEWWVNRTYREGSTMITEDTRPGATAPYISGQEVLDRYGVDAFLEIVDKGSFIKPEANADPELCNAEMPEHFPTVDEFGKFWYDGTLFEVYGNGGFSPTRYLGVREVK